MMLKKELTFALDYALNKGFQIHPNAFEFLENVDAKKLEKIINQPVTSFSYPFGEHIDIDKNLPKIIKKNGGVAATMRFTAG